MTGYVHPDDYADTFHNATAEEERTADLELVARSIARKGRALALWIDDLLAAQTPEERSAALDCIRGVARWLPEDFRELEDALAQPKITGA